MRSPFGSVQTRVSAPVVGAVGLGAAGEPQPARGMSSAATNSGARVFTASEYRPGEGARLEIGSASDDEVLRISLNDHGLNRLVEV
jgi:hypothetical protein